MDSPDHRKTTLTMPLLVSPMKDTFFPLRTELYSPLKLDHDVSSTITVHDEDDQLIETIPVEHQHTLDTPDLHTSHEEDYEEALSETDCESLSSEPSPSPQVSTAQQPLISLAPTHLHHLNTLFETMTPQEILRTCTLIFPNLYQTTAFGLTGLVTLDMLHKLSSSSSSSPSSTPAISKQPEVIFLDTLHHFPQTLDLLPRLQAHYTNPSLNIHVYKPQHCTDSTDFTALHGSQLWDSDAERYDFLAKIEPQSRAERDLRVAAVLTGRRRSQGGDRASLPIIEVAQDTGCIKINPLAKWSWGQVKGYIDENGVPYNELLNLGYRSVGDWHSTEPVGDGEGEREGRWKGEGKAKTECGLHLGRGRYAEFLKEMAEREEKERSQREQERKEGESGGEGEGTKKREEMEEKMEGVEVWKSRVGEIEAARQDDEGTEMKGIVVLAESGGKRVGFDSWGNVF